jgi:hypothetical protein
VVIFIGRDFPYSMEYMGFTKITSTLPKEFTELPTCPIFIFFLPVVDLFFVSFTLSIFFRWGEKVLLYKICYMFAFDL